MDYHLILALCEEFAELLNACVDDTTILYIINDAKYDPIFSHIFIIAVREYYYGHPIILLFADNKLSANIKILIYTNRKFATFSEKILYNIIDLLVDESTIEQFFSLYTHEEIINILSFKVNYSVHIYEDALYWNTFVIASEYNHALMT